MKKVNSFLDFVIILGLVSFLLVFGESSLAITDSDALNILIVQKNDNGKPDKNDKPEIPDKIYKGGGNTAEGSKDTKKTIG